MRISDWSSDVCSSDLRKATTTHQEIHEHRYRLSFEINAKKGQSLGSKGGGYAFAEEGSFGWIASHRRALRSLPPALLQREEITAPRGDIGFAGQFLRSEEHTSELQSLMRISYAVFCLTKKKKTKSTTKPIV